MTRESIDSFILSWRYENGGGFYSVTLIKKDTPSEVVSMIWQYLKLPEESRKRVKAELINVHENYGKEDFQIPNLYDIVPKEEIAEFEDIMRKIITGIISEASGKPPGCMCRNMRNTKLWMKCCKMAGCRPVYYCHGFSEKLTE